MSRNLSSEMGRGRERWIEHYSSGQEMLLVGEGDFSFSACLARAFGYAGNMVATSLESQGTFFKYTTFMFIFSPTPVFWCNHFWGFSVFCFSVINLMKDSIFRVFKGQT